MNTAIGCCKGGGWAVALHLLPMADDVGFNAAIKCQGRKCLGGKASREVNGGKP